MLVERSAMSSTAQPGDSTCDLVGGDRNGLFLRCWFCACHCFDSKGLQPVLVDIEVQGRHSFHQDWVIACLDVKVIAILQHPCVDCHLHLLTDHCGFVE